MTRGAGGFANHTKFEVGDGSKIKFWNDKWWENQALKEAFPVLYSVARVKDASVPDHLEVSSGFITGTYALLE
jgi:hypothetical protein